MSNATTSPAQDQYSIRHRLRRLCFAIYHYRTSIAWFVAAAITLLSGVTSATVRTLGSWHSTGTLQLLVYCTLSLALSFTLFGFRVRSEKAHFAAWCLFAVLFVCCVVIT